MEQIRTVETTEIDTLKKKKRELEKAEEELHNYSYDDYWYDEEKGEKYKQEIADIEEKIKARQQVIQTLTRSNQITNRGSQSSSSTQNNQSQLQRENQELKQILLRLERKVDQLQGQVNRLVNQQRQQQPQAQVQASPKNFSNKKW